MHGYDHQAIESKWQQKWEANGLYRVENNLPGKQNLYTLVEFPYPSGNLHIGHWYAYAVPDIYARYKRMQGYNVLYPFGFDSFGLPAENAAIKHGKDPKAWTYSNIDYMTTQIKRMGNMFDWSRQVISSDPDYYRWTQWLFLQFFEKGLAHRATELANWCPKDLTVLANEQVTDGKCERCGSEVEKREQATWFLKITDYADRLIDDLDDLNWPEEIKTSQRNWIGKSEGSVITFALTQTGADRTRTDAEVNVFTTRPDTLFGATYLVLAPEHKLVAELRDLIDNWADVETYQTEAKKKSEIERTNDTKEKTGVELKGIKAINPANQEEIPLFIADYVLAHYGTGAIMAVPAHDERDNAFAKKFDLPIRQVVAPKIIGSGALAPKSDKNVVEYRCATAIIKHWEEDKYYFVEFQTGEGIGLVGGKCDDRETIEEAARREMVEESGYKNIRSCTHILEYAFGRLYKPRKDREEIGHDSVFLIELDNEDREEIIDPETKVGNWMTAQEFLSDTNADPYHKLFFETALAGLYTGDGVLVNSGSFNNQNNNEAKQKITEAVGGTMKSTYRLRDWSLSRQRYWGCPIPIVYDPDGNPHPVPDEHLPWTLPEDVDFRPTGEAPLASSAELKKRTEEIFGKGWTPEVDTFDTFIDSSWYFLRYTDPNNHRAFASPEALKAWLPIKRYSGGAEHTTMHVLYSRFWHKALYDLGLVFEPEPYLERFNRGQILGPDGKKMSKSKGNVVDPDEHVKRVGADTVKMYLAFMGPYNVPGQYPFDLGGIAGMRRFLERIVKLSEQSANQSLEREGEETERLLNQTIKKIGEDIDQFKTNTAISALMILLNHLEKQDSVTQSTLTTLFQLLAPFAPHLAEELWSRLGRSESIHLQPWPTYDETKLQAQTATLAVQINGKVRASLELPVDSDQNVAQTKALDLPQVTRWLDGQAVKKVIFVPNKIINIVV